MGSLLASVNFKGLPSKKEIELQYKGARCLKINTHPDYPNKVISVSYKKPCVVCGKYHHFMSKSARKCNAKVVGTTCQVFDEVENER